MCTGQGERLPLNVMVTVIEANDLGDVIAKGATEFSSKKDSWSSTLGSLLNGDAGADGSRELSVSHKLALDTGLLMWQDSHRVGSGGGWRAEI
jgi:hypothetical protein